MAIQPYTLTASLTVSVIKARILDRASGKRVPEGNQKTCWNQVGDYLRRNPNTRGTVYLYGTTVEKGEQEYVGHALLTDDNGSILVNTAPKTAEISNDLHTITYSPGNFMTLTGSFNFPNS